MEEMIRQCTQMMQGMMGNTMGGVMGGGMMGGMMNSGTWWASPWYWLGWVWTLAILAMVAVGVMWALRHMRPVSREETPLDILKRRYAQGEVLSEQFEAMKRQLSER